MFLIPLGNRISLPECNHFPQVLQFSKCPVEFSSHTLLHWIGHGPGSRPVLLNFRKRKKRIIFNLSKLNIMVSFCQQHLRGFFFFFWCVCFVKWFSLVITLHFILYSIAHISVGLLLLLYFVLACRDLRASQTVLVVKNLPTNEGVGRDLSSVPG